LEKDIWIIKSFCPEVTHSTSEIPLAKASYMATFNLKVVGKYHGTYFQESRILTWVFLIATQKVRRAASSRSWIVLQPVTPHCRGGKARTSPQLETILMGNPSDQWLSQGMIEASVKTISCSKVSPPPIPLPSLPLHRMLYSTYILSICLWII
jgi:hypothetical protein